MNNKSRQSIVISDDVLQHHGVKGMKWGVRKAAGKISTAYKNRKAKKKADYQKEINKFHNRFKNNKSYNKAYQKTLKKTGSHTKAVQRTAYKVAAKRMALAMVVIHGSPAIISAGKSAAKGLASYATRPETIALGKSLLKTVTRT